MELPIRYNHKLIEEKRYKQWINANYFNSKQDNRKPYVLIVPPPNITGILHMGHILNNTIQDVLIRLARMKGYNACWIPGTDHASIATEAKIISELKKENLSKEILGRKLYLDRVWNWSYKYTNIIFDQLKKMGCSCDWKRSKFTMDKELYQSVIKVFIELYNKGLIYRKYGMINWDPVAKTTISDEEIIYEKRHDKLFYIKYKIDGEKSYLVIATTRPETILGDTAICINPNDSRYTKYKGKRVIVPIVNRYVPIIEDKYVDKSFGTGCLKVTPAHDINDKALADAHNLPIIDLFNEDATFNKNGLHFYKKDRFEVRKEIIKELKEINCLLKVENYVHTIRVSERTKAIIESRLLLQWFFKIKKLAKPALDAVKYGDIKFYPNKYKKNYINWIENLSDWNISRQLWWGHRIPVYYYGKGKNDFVVAENFEEALYKASLITNDPNIKNKLKQDSDVLDTWFSSWLWPISVFDGIRNPNNIDISYYYPINDLVTGHDILFFWVARMIIAGYTFRKQKPFNTVYFTGIIKDNLGRKMSKSLGNYPDTIKLINKYGADAVRVGLLLNNNAGNDLCFNELIFIQGRNFLNKIWNVFRLIKSWKIEYKMCDIYSNIAIKWFKHKLNFSLKKIDSLLKEYKIYDALMLLYKLIWNDFCSLFIEIIKPNNSISINIYYFTIKYFEFLLKILHPYMPFITEEIWQLLKKRSINEALIITKFPNVKSYNTLILDKFENTLKIIEHLRYIRNKQKIIDKKLSLLILKKNNNNYYYPIIRKLADIYHIIFIKEKPSKNNFWSFIIDNDEFYITLNKNIIMDKKKLQQKINFYKNFLILLRNKLSNPKFILYAPKNIISLERKKEFDISNKILFLEEELKRIKN
ncbi:MAG: valine--tRNA ligase [Candidatus Bostrichicola ureolyticus]|nr:MAG: valine--tRNA ligase [Candidatus Bostrichicola ureolyticus]